MSTAAAKGALRMLALLLVGFIALWQAPSARAHEIRPALLDITEREPGWFDVTWKVPVRNGQVLAISPVFPKAFTAVGPPAVERLPGAQVERGAFRRDDGGLPGATIEIEGLTGYQIDVVVQIALADGTTHSAIVRPKAPSYTVPATASGWEVARSYTVMGIEHILGGIDHLLFVLALTLLIPGRWMLVKAITAFTVAHSITLALATFGFVTMPSAPTEAVIALSIVFLATEIVHAEQGRPSMTQRAPWIVAFAFGLFHGLGFAGALTEVGLPQHAIPLALLFFNVGVELGQIAFVLLVLSFLWTTRGMQVSWPGWSLRLPAYGIGTVAAFWTIERIGGFV